jgi:5-methylcytosine-specific restriction endonuclease McrA
MSAAKSGDLIDAYIEGLLTGISKQKPKAPRKPVVAKKKPPSAKPKVTVDEDPKNDAEPKPKRSQKKAVVVEEKEKEKTPKKPRAVKKATENVITGGNSDNQVIRLEIQGVKMEFALKPNQGLAEAKVVDQPAIPVSKPKAKKKTIPKNVKIDTWNHWIGKAKGESKCLCCDIRDIGQNNFECGHIIAESKGGPATITNLKPICSNCNKSMGTRNMDDFKAEHYPTIKGGNKVVEKAVKPKEEKKLQKPTAEVKRGKQLKELLKEGTLKLCPGQGKGYTGYTSTLCSEDAAYNFRAHCNSCGNHYSNVSGRNACPCQGRN